MPALVEISLASLPLLDPRNNYSHNIMARAGTTWRRDEDGPRCPKCGGVTAISDLLRACTDCPTVFQQ